MTTSRWLAAGLILSGLFCAHGVRAQDFTFSDFEWQDAEDAPDTLPTIGGFDRPSVPDELKALAEPAYAELDFAIDQKGKNIIHEIRASSPWVEKAASEAAGQLRYKAASRKGIPVYSAVRRFLIFNPSSAKAKTPDATPRLTKIISPNFPTGKTKQVEGLTLYVKATVDTAGHVTQVESEKAPRAFQEQAEAAVRNWGFAPARKAGVAVESTVRVPVIFIPSRSFSVTELDHPPKVTKQPAPIYPFAQRRARLQAEVLVSFVVSPEGRVTHAEIARSNNPAFNDASIECVLKWQFEPGMKEGKPVSTRMVVPIVFRIDEGSNDAYSIEESRKKQAALPESLRFDYPPRVLNAVTAVYPFSLLQAGADGSVDLAFYVTPTGHVMQPTVASATQPEFGQAALAMIDQFTFQPASKDGKPTLGGLKMKVDFSTFSGDAQLSESARDILHELKRKNPEIVSLKEVDAKPEPISRNKPVFPSTLVDKIDHGDALIEFFIDKDGYARLPRIVSASEEAFGYAAAQAISTWRFKPLKKQGKSVVVRAQIPIKFTVDSNGKAPAAKNEK